MATRDIVVIGGSAGSLEAFLQLVSCLPADFPAAVFIVIHLSARSPGYIVEILRKRSAMPVVSATDGAAAQRGAVYVAPPDRHLLIRDGHMQVTRGPKEGLQRPSINVTFRSAAVSCGNRVIGVLLSGLLDDGAAGVWEIAQGGGVTIVQDPLEAPFPSMPMNALKESIVHHTLPVSEIGLLLPRLVCEEIGPASTGKEAEKKEMARFSGLTCPECRGPLYESANGPGQFYCRVGHLLWLKTLLEEHTSTEERKLYEAIVALDEGADLAERVASAEGGETAARLLEEAAQLRRDANVIRKVVEGRITAEAD